eukprot:1136670-Pelagomonas_calceolata.AAC.8
MLQEWTAKQTVMQQAGMEAHRVTLPRDSAALMAETRLDTLLLLPEHSRTKLTSVAPCAKQK